MKGIHAKALLWGMGLLVVGASGSAMAQQPASGGAQWSRCAVENRTCYIPYGTVVAYGANGVWARKRYNGAGNVDCSNRNFGDPLVGIGKYCYFRVRAEAPQQPQRTQWSTCASENEPCFIPYGTVVAYGASGMWTQRRFNASGNIDCSNRMFGDPLPGVVKSCRFQVRR